MNEKKEKLELLLQKIESREQSARRRATIYSVVPTIIAVALLGSTGYISERAQNKLDDVQKEHATISQDLEAAKLEADKYQSQATALELQVNKLDAARDTLNSTLTELQADVATYEKQIAEKEAQLKTLNEHIGKTVGFIGARYDISWDSPKKMGLTKEQADLLRYIVDLGKEERWQPTASMKETTNSYGFAAYVLEQKGVIDFQRLEDEDIDLGIHEILSQVDYPEIGDLVEYLNNYWMFYFQDGQGTEYCVGMTSFGVVSMKKDFGPEIYAYYRVKY